jgi:DNA-binding GntR family transcriptional regulator
MTRLLAYDSFRARLFSGQLHPGQFVTQRELATLASVPLGAAREAIQKLEHDGLLTVHPQRGIQVADITIRFIREAFQLRQALEVAAIRHFALTRQQEAAALLAETVEILRRAEGEPDEETLAQAVEIDWRMHDESIASMNNSLITEIYQINTVRLRLIRSNIHLTKQRVSGALNEHVGILEACAAGDADLAACRCTEHIETSMRRAMEGM